MEITKYLCSIFLAYCAIIDATSTPSHETEWPVISQFWIHWNQFYDKNYDNRYDELAKFRAWIANLKQVYQHNKEFGRRHSTYSQRLNEFADMTFPAFNFTMLGSLSDEYEAFVSAISFEKLPKSLDWRERGAVTPVKHQGVKCRNGWAFATVGAYEGSLFLETGKLVNLSVQQLVDCVPVCTCAYGSSIVSTKYVAEYGLTSEVQYPYQGYQTACTADSKIPMIDNNSFELLLGKNEIQLKKALVKYGPIAVNIHVTPNFVFYNSGVYFDTDCLHTYKTNHAVLLVGYGNDPFDGDYWLIKNSWGLEWGMGGYAKIARNTRFNCGIATSASVPTPKKRNGSGTDLKYLLVEALRADY